MISPRLARRIAQIHKRLGLIVFAQLVVWTGTGLSLRYTSRISGARLWFIRRHRRPMDVARIRFSSTDALKAVAEDQPIEVALRPLAGEPVYEVRARSGRFWCLPRAASDSSSTKRGRGCWRKSAGSRDSLLAMELLPEAPKESGLAGEVWAARFKGDGHPTLHVSSPTGKVSAPRTDLWRTYDFLWQLHLMDWGMNENFNTPWMVGAAILALSSVLFGAALLVHRFTRGFIGKGAE